MGECQEGRRHALAADASARVSVVVRALLLPPPTPLLHSSPLFCPRRMTLRGFASFDLEDMPAVRPGFSLGLLDPCPSRTTPLGCSETDKLMPTGEEGGRWREGGGEWAEMQRRAGRLRRRRREWRVLAFATLPD
jgi:hypothetical protein